MFFRPGSPQPNVPPLWMGTGGSAFLKKCVFLNSHMSNGVWWIGSQKAARKTKAKPPSNATHRKAHDTYKTLKPKTQSKTKNLCAAGSIGSMPGHGARAPL